ncbi:MAG: filamentous hemagglutinin N-terminal domain-containing protein [Stigonema ocellatum SAG 48.90 = DSM 106950]|nr:filamentous hemagglutinin N-terminal domain-containing protein [Stigonema ocellatum SAG 48.90 = DSM 106950]
MSNLWNWLGKLGLIATIAIVSSSNCVEAQITPDSTLPNNSNVRLEGNTRIIEGGTTRGANLFHSFSEFSVPTGSTALFNNALDIQNIISRVTGKSISEINGLIKSNGTANVFLMNPNGIIFGKDASLNIGGSFVATTANAIGFGNLGFFSASNPEAPSPLLTINPNALLFNQIAAASIQNSSTAGLRVEDGKSLLLVGGNVNMDGGRLNAYGGRVELGGLAASGNVGLNVDGNNLSLSFPDNITPADVSFTNGASVHVEAAGGGNIALNARNLEVTSGSVLSAGIGFGLGSVGTRAGDITLHATGEIKVVGQSSGVMNNVRAKALGNGGDINIKTGSLAVDSATIEDRTFGQGNAGNLTIAAPEQVSFTNRAFGFTTAETGSVGNGGDISIQAGSVYVTNGSQLKASTLGRGNSGNLTIDARDTVEFMNGAFAFSQVQAGMGNGGTIRISTGSLSVTNGSILSASTLGEGNAGTLMIDARDTVSFTNSGGAFTTVEQGAMGNGNDLQIQARSVLVSSGSFLTANTLGQGNAGNVIIDARDSVGFDNGRAVSEVESLGVGKGGNVNITTGSLSLTNSALLSTRNFGQRGNAGNVTINAQDNISLNGTGVFSSVESPGVGNGGDISITTGSLSLTNLAQLYASSHGLGNAGKVTINARDSISLNGGAVFSSVESPGVGNGGDISITTGSLSLTNGAQLYASNRGQGGNAGKVAINARDSISLNGGAVFSSVESPEVGNGGDISITTGSLSLTNLAQLYASSRGLGNAGKVAINARDSISLNGGAVFSSVESPGVGNGGDISITTGSLSLTNGAQLFTTNRGQEGNAGNVTINARDRISFNGASIFSSVESQTVGNDRNTSTTTGSLTLTDGVQMNANNQVQGTAGDIQIRSSSIQLDNQAGILARTTFGNGGNITLNSQNFLLLRRNSQISTTAGTAQLGGNGGKITINAPSGFVVATKGENNDITANAFNGSGGVIKINALGIYNFNQIRLEDLEKLLGTNDPTKLDPQLLTTNDITAISLTNPALSGQVNIVTPDIDPSRGLVKLPINFVDAQQQISTACNPGSRQFQNTFVATGRGGLPISPTEPLQDSGTLSTWVRLKTQPENSANTTTQSQPAAISNHTKVAATTPIVAATGWVIDRNGNIHLVAQVPQVNPHITLQTPTTCPVSR